MSLELFSLTGKRALITGSSRGIGLALARGLGEAGASIVLNARNDAPLAAAEEHLRDQGIVATRHACDVTDPDAVDLMVDLIETHEGPIDILVNNAGMQHRAPLEDFPRATFNELMRLNVNAAFYAGQAVARHMIGRRAGKIINICSLMTFLARKSITPYTASKGAMAAMTRGMATDWAPSGLNVNGIAPGYFKTELNEALWSDPKFSAWLEERTPMRRWGELDELIGAAIYLASDASRFVNGQVITVDGGISASV
ncbi:MAG: SDR family oxidoreductase [Hyphomicrobiaceae bacterium]|nr:SDR family oxidoreductase [Hyphomicrobiaceae bacterium]